jgi:hypothetical protein
MVIDTVLLTTDGDIKDIKTEDDKIHEVLGGAVTFIGSIPNLDVVACANREKPLCEPNVFCSKLGFDTTSSDIMLIRTDTNGNPQSFTSIGLKEFINNPIETEDIKYTSRFGKPK